MFAVLDALNRILPTLAGEDTVEYEVEDFPSEVGSVSPRIRRGRRSRGAYRAAGVDIEEGERAVARIRALVRRTFTPRVESEIGVFAGFFSFPEPGSDRLLVASMDGVGTKLKLAAQTGALARRRLRHRLPLRERHPRARRAARSSSSTTSAPASSPATRWPELVEGMSEACLEAGCALIGGETAEMPGMYPPGELDLGRHDRRRGARSGARRRRAIAPGDRLIALPSAGCTRTATRWRGGSSGPTRIPPLSRGRIDGAEGTLARPPAAAAPDVPRPVVPLLEAGLDPRHGAHHRRGAAGNLPRVLPPGAAGGGPAGRVGRSRRSSAGWWRGGGVDEDEACRVFNMGVGFLPHRPAPRGGRGHGAARRGRGRPLGDRLDRGGAPGVRWG